MEDCESLAHVRWERKYHVAFIPKYRKKVIFGRLRVSIGQILRELCEQKELLQECRMPSLHFGATGYCISTVGWDEGAVRK